VSRARNRSRASPSGGAARQRLLCRRASVARRGMLPASGPWAQIQAGPHLQIQRPWSGQQALELRHRERWHPWRQPPETGRSLAEMPVRPVREKRQRLPPSRPALGEAQQRWQPPVGEVESRPLMRSDRLASTPSLEPGSKPIPF
jgi:hypothetical protein